VRWLHISEPLPTAFNVAIGNRAKSGGSNLAGTTAREDMRPVQRTLVLPDLTGCSLSSVDLAWVLADVVEPQPSADLSQGLEPEVEVS
jgi:hypothetical protein